MFFPVPTPKRVARFSAAEPAGSWSVIRSSEPPLRTQSWIASHSCSVNAALAASGLSGSAAPKALAITSTSKFRNVSFRNLSVNRHAVTIIIYKLCKRPVCSLRSVQIKMRFIKQHSRMPAYIGRRGNRCIEVWVRYLLAEMRIW